MGKWIMPQQIKNLIIREVNYSEIIRLLENCELPTRDLNPNTSIFMGAFYDEDLVGCIGLEKIGDSGLLRSLAVDQNYRGEGIGFELTKAVLTESIKKSYSEVYLLTTDAEKFFIKAGFYKIIKENSPKAVKETKQYREICSDSAVVMKINLA
jgi:amino-acid N-acetyltransferase